MSPKPDLNALLADAGGSARHKRSVEAQPAEAEPAESRAKPKPKAARAGGRAATSPITVHFPKNVRDQLKILAVQKDKTLHVLVAEAFNDLFAKYGKPEIVPIE
jgi:hypothetical protein